MNHSGCGATEFVAIKGKVLATGFFDKEGSFLAACRAFKHCNLYAGRNPRPAFFCRNGLSFCKKRARDRDIKYLTAISLDIDPVRPRNQPSDDQQHQTALRFALKMQRELGGWVDDSGNGAYLWLPFATPTEVKSGRAMQIKRQFQAWQEDIKRRCRPEDFDLRIDGCYDFSRIKRVIGTFNFKAGRISQFVRKGEPDDLIRNQILALYTPPKERVNNGRSIRPAFLSSRFKRLLEQDDLIREIWDQPDVDDDSSRRDWLLGRCCIEAGILDPEELIAILMHNPHGKYQRDRRHEYVVKTVENLLDGPVG